MDPEPIAHMHAMAAHVKEAHAATPPKKKQKRNPLLGGIDIKSVVIVFEVPEGQQDSFMLPPHVVAKLEQYSYCLFE